MKRPAAGGERRPWVQRLDGGRYLYYRREDRREPLPGPEGSAAFLAAYDEIHAQFEGKAVRWAKHTVDAAIAALRATPEFLKHSEATRRHYDLYLKELSRNAGAVSLLSIDRAWITGLRNRLADDAIRWNRYRSLMKMAWDAYLDAEADFQLPNPWGASKRLSVDESDQNRAWPEDVILRVMQAATPEFRSLLTCLLLTAQRLGDTCRMPNEAYDPDARTLAFRQGKTNQAMRLRVPDLLAEAFESMRGRVPGFLLCTPRGKAWTTLNAQETLLTARANLDIGRYTLHGLRATGPSAAYQQGVSLRELMAITGHTTEQNMRIYLRWVLNAPLAAKAGEAIENTFAPVIEASLTPGANRTKASGLTGRAAAKAGRQAECGE